MGEREAIRGRMTGVLEVQWLGGRRIDAHGAFGGHIHQHRRLDRPLGSVAIEANRRRFHTQEFTDETREGGHRPPWGAARNGCNGITLLDACPLIGNQADGPVPFPHYFRCEAEDNETQAIERDATVPF